MEIKSIRSKDFAILASDNDFKYQKELTIKLDRVNSDFNQEIINEIVLWKVNRYASIKSETLDKINTVDQSDVLNKELTKEILTDLLNKSTRGIQLAMASTILRFKNPKVYQIIDQRVYRLLYSKELDIVRLGIDEQIEMYFQYLTDLKKASTKYKISFEKSDRILYEADKRMNKAIPLKNYNSVGSKVK